MAQADRFEQARRRAAEYREGDEPGDASTPRPTPRGRRPEDQVHWVDQQVRAAMARGDFDDLPLAGKPLPHRSSTHDPDWWVKQLIEREQITGVLPPALALRREDAELDTLLDRTGSAERVRELVEDFNRRIVEARRQLQGGPPVITALRDVEAEINAWRVRRRARAEATRIEQSEDRTDRPVRHRRWRRRRHRD